MEGQGLQACGNADAKSCRGIFFSKSFSSCAVLVVFEFSKVWSLEVVKVELKKKIEIC